MDLSNTPQLIVALSISSYWICVGIMSIRSRIKYRVPSGSLPKTRMEKRMWLIWVPTIIAWIALSWNTTNQVSQWLVNSGSSMSVVWQAIVWLAAIVTVTAFAMTTRCWLRMGKNWSMAVRPDKETELITDGMFAAVRHPIYTFSLLLMIGTLIVNFGWPMLLVASIHCSMLVIKSWSEEKYLAKVHGQQYHEYLARTNRFIPVRAVWNYCMR